MRKSLYIGVFYLLFGHHCLHGNDLAKRQQVIAYANTHVGVRETAHNSSPFIDKYLASVGTRSGQPWCAAFVNYVLVNCGVKTVRSAWSPSWFPKNKVIYSVDNRAVNPQAGDVFGIWFANLGRIAHVGLVESWTNGHYFITIEGNTNEAGSREGDGVLKKRRHKKQVYQVSNWISK